MLGYTFAVIHDGLGLKATPTKTTANTTPMHF
jgi:hypothetical protein